MCLLETAMTRQSIARSGLLFLQFALMGGSCRFAFGEEPRVHDLEAKPGILDRAAKEPIAIYQIHDSLVDCLVFTPDGKKLVAAGNNRPILILERAHQDPSATLQASARTMTISPSGKLLATSAMHTSVVRIWNLASCKEKFAITVPEAIEVPLAIFSSDGRKLLTLDWNQGRDNHFWFRHWDALTGELHRSLAIPKEMYPLTVAPDGQTVLGVVDQGGIGIYDVASDRIVFRRHLEDGGIRSHDLQSGRRQLFRASYERVFAFLPTHSPDARLLTSGMRPSDSTIRVWEIITGEEVFRVNQHKPSVAAIVWSPDGRLLASGDQRTRLTEPFGAQTVRVWSSATGRELARFDGFAADVTALAFAPDSARLAAGFRDGTILVWDVAKLERKPGPALTLGRNELESCWADLAGTAGKAHRAVGMLAAAPAESVPFLRSRLAPAVVADAGKIEQWIVDLDSTKYAVRQAAAGDLEKADLQAQPFIDKALKKNLSLETRLRLEKIVKTLSGSPAPSTLRAIRAVVALERIGSPAGQDVLELLASGAPTRVRDEARASLLRLASKSQER
jgi:WD40 repeat protein